MIDVTGLLKNIFGHVTNDGSDSPEAPIFGLVVREMGHPSVRHGKIIRYGDEVTPSRVTLDPELYYSSPCTSTFIKTKEIEVTDEYDAQEVVVLVGDTIEINARLAAKYVVLIANKITVSADICAKYLYCGSLEHCDVEDKLSNVYCARICTYCVADEFETVKCTIGKIIEGARNAEMNAIESLKYVNATTKMIRTLVERKHKLEDSVSETDRFWCNTRNTQNPSKTSHSTITDWLVDSSDMSTVDKSTVSHETSKPVTSEESSTPSQEQTAPMSGTSDDVEAPRQTNLRFDAVDDMDTDEELDMPDLFLIGKGGSIDGKIKPTVVTDSTTTDETTEQNKQTVTTRRRSK